MIDDVTDKLIELEKKEFSGNVTLHYQGGVARKIRVEEVQDLPVVHEQQRPRRRMIL